MFTDGASYFERERYSLVSVLIVMVSPSVTKCGTLMTIPVSSVAGLSVLLTAAVFIPGSVWVTFSGTGLGGETVRGGVLENSPSTSRFGVRNPTTSSISSLGIVIC